MVYLVNLCVIQTKIGSKQVFIVTRHLYTVNMRAEILIGNASHALMIHFIGDLSYPAVLIKPEHGDLAVMIACHKKITVAVIRRKIAASHAVYGCVRDSLELAVFFDMVSFHAVVGDGIKHLAVMGYGHIGGVADLHLLLFGEYSLFHIHVIDTHAHLAALGITRYICNIFTCHVFYLFSMAVYSLCFPTYLYAGRIILPLFTSSSRR